MLHYILDSKTDQELKTKVVERHTLGSSRQSCLEIFQQLSSEALLEQSLSPLDWIANRLDPMAKQTLHCGHLQLVLLLAAIVEPYDCTMRCNNGHFKC